MSKQRTHAFRIRLRSHPGLCLLFSLLALFWVPFALPAADVDDSIVRVFGTDAQGLSSGTGFLVSGSRKVLTNHHVIEGADKIAVGFLGPSGHPKLYSATLLWSDPDLDLALLETKQDLLGEALAFISQSPPNHPAKDTTVIAIGFPGAADIFSSTSNNITPSHYISSHVTGSVSRVFKGDFDRHNHMVIQHSAQINPGNSGGLWLIAVTVSGA